MFCECLLGFRWVNLHVGNKCQQVEMHTTSRRFNVQTLALCAYLLRFYYKLLATLNSIQMLERRGKGKLQMIARSFASARRCGSR